MDFLNNPDMQQICIVAGVIGLLVAAGSIASLVLAAQSIRDLEIPPDADFFETMQAIPITIPIALDLLDLPGSQTLMVGDSSQDDVGGVFLKIRTLILPRTEGPVHGLGAVLRMVGNDTRRA